MTGEWEQAQDEFCRRHDVPVTRPADEQYVGIDPRGLLPAAPVLYGARHPQVADDDTGWCFTTDAYEDDPQLVKVHVGHLPDVCPAVLPFLALPIGWYFDTASGAAAFDGSLASQ
jgi:hypothetical protein